MNMFWNSHWLHKFIFCISKVTTSVYFVWFFKSFLNQNLLRVVNIWGLIDDQTLEHILYIVQH